MAVEANETDKLILGWIQTLANWLNEETETDKQVRVVFFSLFEIMSSMEPKLIESNWDRSDSRRLTLQMQMQNRGTTRAKIPKSVTMIGTQLTERPTDSNFSRAPFYEMLNPELVSNTRSVRRNLQKTFMFDKLNHSMTGAPPNVATKVPISQFDAGEPSNNLSAQGPGMISDDSKLPLRENDDISILGENSVLKGSHYQSVSFKKHSLFFQKDQQLEIHQKESQDQSGTIQELIPEEDAEARKISFFKAFQSLDYTKQSQMIRFLESLSK